MVGDLIWLNFGITDGYVLGGINEFIVEDILDYEAINNGGKWVSDVAVLHMTCDAEDWIIS